jgi:hypothetical protein
VRPRPHAEWRSTVAIRCRSALSVVRSVAYLFRFFGFAAVAAFPGCSGVGQSAGPSLLTAWAPTPGATTPSPSGSTSPSPSSVAITYNASTACINHFSYTNNGISGNNGEFDTLGFNRSFWSATQTRTLSPQASWPGLQASWGRFQYDTYFGDQSDGSGNDPFNVSVDPNSGVQALSILAEPMPANMKGSPAYGAGWTAANLTASIVSPPIGGSVTIPVNGTNQTHQGWLSGIGRPAKTAGSGEDDPQGVVLIGTVTAGGCTVTQSTGSCTGGSNQITLSNVKYYEGGPGVTIPSGADFQDWQFTDYYSGTLDLNLPIEYGFFVARLRLPAYAPALSPAFWTLQTGGEPSSASGIERNEDDIEEMFGATSGNALNAGQIHWNTSPSQFWPTPTGVYNWPLSGDPSTTYHDYGMLLANGSTTFYLDGTPISSHAGGPDWTNGTADKELMLMFQVGAPGSWLDPNSQGSSDSWPQYLWSQWIRVYQPTASSC